jgi:hypothetical protein
MRHQEKYREASFDGADGVVVQDQTEMFSNLNYVTTLILTINV